MLSSVIMLAAAPLGATGDGSWWMLGFYLGLALGVSFLCSLLEAGLLSLPRSHIEVMVEQGRRSGLWLKRMIERIDRPLAAILTLNTIAHTIGAAGVGAEVMVLFGEASVAIASAVVTLLILVLSEIIPKSLGAAHSKRLAPFTAHATQVLIWATWPVVLVLDALSRRIAGGHKGGKLSRDELRLMAELGGRSGALAQDELRVIRNLLRLGEVKVQDIMTPRSVVFMLDAKSTVAQVLAQHERLPFSRMPIHEGGPDHIVGKVHRRDLLHALRAGRGDQPVGELAHSIPAVPESANVGQVLQEMTTKQLHLYQVVDEFGGTAGIVTMEDAIETLLGVEIIDESDTVVDMRVLARERANRRRTLTAERYSD